MLFLIQLKKYSPTHLQKTFAIYLPKIIYNSKQTTTSTKYLSFSDVFSHAADVYIVTLLVGKVEKYDDAVSIDNDENISAKDRCI